MLDQINSQFVALSRQFADSALKANSLALQNVEQLVQLQLRTVEDRLTATAGFWAEAAEVRDLETAQTLLPKGVQLMRESAEQFYGVGQEALGRTLKTSEAIGTLAKAQFEAASATASSAASEGTAKATRQGKAAR